MRRRADTALIPMRRKALPFFLEAGGGRVYVVHEAPLRQKGLKSTEKSPAAGAGLSNFTKMRSAQYFASTGADEPNGLKCQFTPARIVLKRVDEVCEAAKGTAGAIGPARRPRKL